MIKIALNTKPQDGLVMIEHHAGYKEVWTARSEKDFIQKAMLASERTDWFWAENPTFGDARDFISHDLQSLEIIRHSEISQKELDTWAEDYDFVSDALSNDVLNAYHALNWAEFEEDDDKA